VRIVVGCIVLAACALSPPRAVVSITPLGGSGPARNAVLVLSTACVADEDYLCDPRTYVRDADGNAMFAVAATFAEVIDPLVRLKLELAGLTLADAGSLRLETADRVDRSESRTTDGLDGASSSTSIGDVPTLLSLPPDELVSAAHSIGLQAMLSSTLRVVSAKHGRKVFEVRLELRAIPENATLWTVRCSEPLEQVEATARLLADCVGNGVLASLAPDALIQRAL
jgi:hypothetical protein